jgi:hypothetical protein
MITKKMWYEFFSLKVVDSYSWFCTDEEITPRDKAGITIVLGIITPITMFLDIVGIPVEILYVILKRKYEKELKEVRNERN